MSTTLYFRQLPKEPPPPVRIGSLKYIIYNYFKESGIFLENDTSCGQVLGILNKQDVLFFKGVLAATIGRDDQDEIKELINAIESHGEIEVFLED